MAALPVETFHCAALGVRAFTERFFGQAPVIARGLAAHWPATQKWCDPKYLVNVCGADNLVSVERCAANANFSDEKLACGIDELLDHLAEAPKGGVYLAQTPIEDVSHMLKNDIHVPDYIAQHETSLQQNIWIGKGSLSPLHWDHQHNILAQVCGSKHIRLYPPESSAAIYPEQEWQKRNVSMVKDIYAEDIARHFPLFVDEPWFECSLEETDALYIPPRWWHHVEASQEKAAYNISVNFWWLDQ